MRQLISILWEFALQTVRHAARGAIRAGILGGSLRPRIVGRAESLPGPSWFGLLVDTGKAWIAGQDAAIDGPALTWRPWPSDARARFAAGTTGSYVLVGSSALASVVGYMPEARELRDSADRSVIVPLHDDSETLQKLRFAFFGISRELDSGDVAARAVVEAYLRLILVEVHRASRPEMAGSERTSPSRRAFARFSDLVESHFRERWTVNDYARSLGMSRDRLGDICVSVRGMGPKQLVDRRVTIEARLQLENSSNSIQQISALLGFHSPPQFTRFFTRTTGVSPGLYRQNFLREVELGQRDQALPYEWP